MAEIIVLIMEKEKYRSYCQIILNSIIITSIEERRISLGTIRVFPGPIRVCADSKSS